MAPFTAMPIALIMAINITLSLIVFTAKSHFYQPGILYFVLSNLLASFLLPFTHALFSFTMESTPIASLLFFDRLLQILLTALISFPIYQVFIWFDKITDKKLPTETGRNLE